MIVGVLLYSAYVLAQLPRLALPVAALMLLGLAASALTRQRAWLSAHALVLAVLHARALGAGDVFVTLQLGLAGAVAASATMSLFAPLRAPRLALVLSLSVALALLVAAPAGVEAAIAGGLGGVLAGLRPWSALARIRGSLARDPWLAWTPLAGGPS